MAMNFNSNWEQIQQGVSDTERLIRQKDYNASMIKARQTLEFMVRVLMERAGLEDEADLKNMIDLLYQERRISKSACEHYHKIRIIGNKAVHEGDTNAYNANQAYHMLSQEVYAFATDNGLARRSRTGQSSRSQAEQGSRSRTEQSSRGGQRNTMSASSNADARGRYPVLTPALFGSGSAQDGPSAIPGNSRNSQRRPAQKNPSGSRSPKRRPAASSSNHSRRRTPQRRKGFTLYDLLKLLVPILCIILLFFVVKLLKPDTKPEETTAAPVSTEAAMPETIPDPTEPETDAPAVYKTTDVLNVRPQPNTTDARIGQLEAGVTVDYVRAHDEEWAVILYNGQEAYVASQYLTAE